MYGQHLASPLSSGAKLPERFVYTSYHHSFTSHSPIHSASYCNKVFYHITPLKLLLPRVQMGFVNKPKG